MRNILSRALCMSCLIALLQTNAPSASAQITLKELQEQIRQRQGNSAPRRPTDARRPAATRQPAATERPATPQRSTPAQQPGYLGLMADDAKDRGRGVRVTNIRPIGPAAMGGVLKGDLITSIDGVRVRQMSDMAAILGVCRAGQTIAVDVLRADKKQSLKITLGHRPTTGQPSTTATAPEPVRLPTPVPIAAKPPVEGPQLVPPKPQTLAKEPAEPAEPEKDEKPKAEEPKAETPSTEYLLRRIEELEKRVKQLEKALAERP